MDRRSALPLAAGAILAMAVAVGAVATDVVHPPIHAPTEVRVPPPARDAAATHRQAHRGARG